jgi:indole-3-acetate monooxygenase
MARWEPSFSWIITQAAGDMATYVSAADPSFAAAFLADQHANTASSDNGAGTLTPEGDGFRLEGRWGFCSGCQGATWVGGLAKLPVANAGDVPEARFALVPVERAAIDENWNAMGMIGTGSHTVDVEPQHIPAAWTIRIDRWSEKEYGPMSAAAGNSAWPIATSVAAIQLGLARRALDAAGDLLKVKTARRGTAPLIENARVQFELITAEGAWLACYAGVEQALVRLWQHAEINRRLPVEDRLALFAANVHASASATRIIGSVCDVVGSSVAPVRGIFGACLRDARIIGSHAIISGSKIEIAAQMRYGLLEDSFWI